MALFPLGTLVLPSVGALWDFHYIVKEIQICSRFMEDHKAQAPSPALLSGFPLSHYSRQYGLCGALLYSGASNFHLQLDLSPRASSTETHSLFSVLPSHSLVVLRVIRHSYELPIY